MKVRKFRTRRMWSNTLLMLWLFPFAVLIGAIAVALTDSLVVLVVLAIVSGIGITIAMLRDIGNRSTYIVGAEKLILHDGRKKLAVPMADLVDASMIDRMAAREYIRSRSTGSGDKAPQMKARELIKDLTRFCSVDLGLTTFTFGMGRSMIDQMPQSKNDLVLLRLRSGKDYFLSPIDNVELATTINRLIRQKR
ncbi:MAG: hypothetical protein KA408_03465 [Flavobacteriales bacterium]|nr:hypothetical protein [Flavobacteriales bacterium]